MWLEGKQLAIGVCGSIAAYRACDLVRECQRQGADGVHALLTKAASRFVSPLTFQSLTMRPVYEDDLAVTPEGVPVHIAMAQQCDALVIAPASADALARFATGAGSDLLATTFLCFSDKPVVIAPAMNPRMWAHPLVQHNISTLAALPNVQVIPPAEGLLACGETGAGHFPDTNNLILLIARACHGQPLAGKRVWVTGGGTEAPIDPVRVISNRSSGRMGLALADAAWVLGADVVYVTANADQASLIRPYACHHAPTADEMRRQLQQGVPEMEWLVMAAAVSDFAMADGPATDKVRRHDGLSLALTAEADILAGLATARAGKNPGLKLIGFAAEAGATGLETAQGKLAKKGIDAIVLNDVGRTDIGFGTPDNEATLILPEGQPLALPKASKPKLALNLLQQLAQRWI